MKHFLKKIFLPLIYARRDMRAGLKGFYIFLACLVLGVGAIASIQSLSRGLVQSLHHDGRFILGGDIALRTVYKPATPEEVNYLNDKIGPMTTVVETRAMARTTDGRNSTLVDLKAVGVFYPLYGALRIVDEKGSVIERDLDRYHIFRADEMPELTTIFVETFEPSHPFGVKAVAEIPMDGVAPAVGNAVLDAVGVNIDENPVTPEKVWKALKH